MKNKWFWLFIMAVSIMAWPVRLSAQITYTSDGITINGARKFPFNMTVNNMNGIYWGYQTNRFFLIDLNATVPRFSGSGNEISFHNPTIGTYNNIRVANVLNYSDGRAKTDIESLDGCLGTILSLRPVSYNWKTAPQSTDSTTEGPAARSVPMGPQGETNKQYGFIAQELEEVLPDAVKTTEEGEKLINYTALIPVLVQSVQELQAIIDQQNSVIENLSSRLENELSNSSDNSDYIISCTPNPTLGEITFAYSLSPMASSARIMVTDLAGTQMSTVDCRADASSVTTDLSSLPNGLYLATLIVDGGVKDTKQIVVAR